MKEEFTNKQSYETSPNGIMSWIVVVTARAVSAAKQRFTPHHHPCSCCFFWQHVRGDHLRRESSRRTGCASQNPREPWRRGSSRSGDRRECVSVWSGRERGGQTWQDQTWTPWSEVCGPSAWRCSAPECSRASAPAQRPVPDEPCGGWWQLPGRFCGGPSRSEWGAHEQPISLKLSTLEGRMDYSASKMPFPTLRILARTSCTLQISRLQRRPYSPQMRSSWSRRSRS